MPEVRGEGAHIEREAMITGSDQEIRRLRKQINIEVVGINSVTNERRYFQK